MRSNEAPTMASSSDKQQHHYRYQPSHHQQLQLRQLEDYTYYATSTGGKLMSTTVYDCPCGGGNEGNGTSAGIATEARHSSKDMYGEQRPKAGKCYEPPRSLPSCDLCAVQQRPAALFDYGNSAYYDQRMPWQSMSSPTSSTTYSRLPVVSRTGNTEMTYGTSHQPQAFDGRSRVTGVFAATPEVHDDVTSIGRALGAEQSAASLAAVEELASLDARTSERALQLSLCPEPTCGLTGERESVLA